MTIEEHIEKCQASLAQLNRMRVALEDSGLYPNDPALDMSAAKSWRLIYVWEIYASLLPQNRFEIQEFITLSPDPDQHTINIDEVLGFQNLDNHIFMEINMHLFNGN